MNRSTIIRTAALACFASAAGADELDLFPPWWRHVGPFAIEVAWTWPAPPSSNDHMLPSLFMATGENPPRGVLMDAPGFGTLNGPDWSWQAVTGRPGMLALTDSSAEFLFPWWELGVGFQMPLLLRLQLTYDGPSPAIQLAPGILPPVRFDPDAHHVYYDQEVWGMTSNIIVLGIPAGSVLREVHIDTFGFPAPGSGVLLGLGALVVTRRRR